MKQSALFFEAQQVALGSLTAAVGSKCDECLAAQGPDEMTARVESIVQYGTTLFGRDQTRVASAMPTLFGTVSEEEAELRLFRVDVKHYFANVKGNFTLKIREIDMAIRSSLVSLEDQQVSLDISKLYGRARESAMTCRTSVDLVFSSWESLKLVRLRVFSPNQACRVRSRFLSTRQGMNELTDYVRELRTLMAAMQSDPLGGSVYVTVFMEGLRTGVARIEVFRAIPLLLKRL